MLNINGVPQITMNGVEIVNGSRIVTPTLNQIAIINGAPQTAHQGVEIINGVPKSAFAAESEWPNFTGWNETDPNGYLGVDDANAFDAIWTIGDGSNPIQGAGESYMRIYADAGSAFWTGDFELQYRCIVQNSVSTIALIFLGFYDQLIKSATIPSGGTEDVIHVRPFEVGGNNLSGNGGVIADGATEGSLTLSQFLQQLGNSTYWTLKRVGTTVSWEGWTNSDRSGGANWSVSAAGITVKPYRYLYLFNMIDISTVKTAQWEIQCESITPNPWA